MRADQATGFVPEGLSGWELSVERSAGAKADRDYDKRTTSPDGSPTAACTYVAVSLRVWRQRREWATRRSGEGRWKSVRALGLDEVEQWVEDAPVTHAWLSEQLGLEPHGIRTLDRWWLDWSTQTDPVLPAALVLAGREEAANELRQKLASAPQTITISGTSRDEVLAFVAAVALGEGASAPGSLLARTAVVDQVTAWRSLVMRSRSLVLVAAADAVISETGGRQVVHHVIAPVPKGASADIELPPINAAAASKAFEGSLSDEDSSDVARLARLSLLAARRQLGVKKELLRPDWAVAPVAREVRRLLLANRWSSAHESDRDVVSRLVGEPYSAVAEQVVKYSAGADPLVTTIDAAVILVSPYDAYSLLVGSLTTEDLAEFKPIALEVLRATNPALELAPDQRWQASVLGKVRPHSNDLRQGIANALALLGTLGTGPVHGTATSPADWAASTVRDLLSQANEAGDASIWASLDDVLPELAEAAPSELLDAVAEALRESPPLLQGIFIDEEAAGMFAHQSHTGMLWALEICAWSSEHLSRAVDALAGLAEIDRGSPRYLNRPINSLREIFLPWHPQNSVDLTTRLEVIDGLRARHPRTSWRLMLALLPENHGVAHGTHPPSYREWKPEDKPVLMGDYWAMVRSVAERLHADVGDSVDRWAELIGKFDDLPSDLRSRFLESLDAVGRSARLDDEGRARIFETLDELVGRHREFAGEAAWALPATEVDAMSKVAEQFRPAGRPAAHRWLFAEHMPSISGAPRRTNFEEYSAVLARLRKEAIAEIADAATWQQLLTFVRESKVPDAVGIALSQAAVTKYETEIVGLLDTAEWSNPLVFARAYFGNEFAKDSQRATRLLAQRQLSALQRARVLLALWDRDKEWQALKSEQPEVALAYWREFPRFPGRMDVVALKTVTRGLRSVGRVGAALDLLAILTPKEETDLELAELIADSLERFVREGGADAEVTPAEYDFVRLFEYMDRSLPVDRVAALEWSYLTALEHSERTFALHQMLSDDPDLFVGLITRIFRPREEEADSDSEVEPTEAAPEVDEATRRVALNAYRLLDSWKSLPGAANGTVDPERLRTWVDRARSELTRLKRRSIGDDQIGKVLAHSPAGHDGAWPAEPVRDVLEAMGNKQVDDGFVVEIRNSRGVWSKGLESGGDQERQLAEKYREYSRSVAGRWPHTSALLRRVADGYDREARREDEEAERWRTGIEGPGSGPVRIPSSPGSTGGLSDSAEELKKALAKVRAFRWAISGIDVLIGGLHYLPARYAHLVVVEAKGLDSVRRALADRNYLPVGPRSIAEVWSSNPKSPVVLLRPSRAFQGIALDDNVATPERAFLDLVAEVRRGFPLPTKDLRTIWEQFSPESKHQTERLAATLRIKLPDYAPAS